MLKEYKLLKEWTIFVREATCANFIDQKSCQEMLKRKKVHNVENSKYRLQVVFRTVKAQFRYVLPPGVSPQQFLLSSSLHCYLTTLF